MRLCLPLAGGGGGGGLGDAPGIHDATGVDVVNLRRTIYLTIMSSLDFEEAGHKLLKMNIPQGLVRWEAGCGAGRRRCCRCTRSAQHVLHGRDAPASALPVLTGCETLPCLLAGG